MLQLLMLLALHWPMVRTGVSSLQLLLALTALYAMTYKLVQAMALHDLIIQHRQVTHHKERYEERFAHTKRLVHIQQQYLQAALCTEALLKRSICRDAHAKRFLHRLKSLQAAVCTKHCYCLSSVQVLLVWVLLVLVQLCTVQHQRFRAVSSSQLPQLLLLLLLLTLTCSLLFCYHCVHTATQHDAQMWKDNMIVYGGLTTNFDLASDMLALGLSGVTAASLVPAADDPSLSYARPNFSLIQLLFALGMAAACICVFFSVVSHFSCVANGASRLRHLFGVT
jgi:hypothetical protein